MAQCDECHSDLIYEGMKVICPNCGIVYNDQEFVTDRAEIINTPENEVCMLHHYKPSLTLRDLAVIGQCPDYSIRDAYVILVKDFVKAHLGGTTNGHPK